MVQLPAADKGKDTGREQQDSANLIHGESPRFENGAEPGAAIDPAATLCLSYAGY